MLEKDYNSIVYMYTYNNINILSSIERTEGFK